MQVTQEDDVNYDQYSSAGLVQKPDGKQVAPSSHSIPTYAVQGPQSSNTREQKTRTKGNNVKEYSQNTTPNVSSYKFKVTRKQRLR